MESIVQQRDDAEKISMKFRRLKRRSLVYFISFIVCELLNISSLVICFATLNALLSEKFVTYGKEIHDYYMNNGNVSTTNPMCNLFPTEVSCDVSSLGVQTNHDGDHVLCILSNNQFNQYYFLVLWIWWTFLLLISVIGLLYRLVQLSTPSAGEAMFRYSLVCHGLEDKVDRIDGLRSWDFFLLSRIVRNLRTREIESLLCELSSKHVEQECMILTEQNL